MCNYLYNYFVMASQWSIALIFASSRSAGSLGGQLAGWVWLVGLELAGWV